MKDEQIQVLSLNPAELIRWCKGRKNTLGISNAKLAEISGVPIGTIDRIMSGNYSEFKYSSIQPLIAVLVGYGQEVPEPKHDNEQELYYYETIEGYKLVVDNKNHEIEYLKNQLERRTSEVEYLKTENIDRQEMIKRMSDHIKWLEDLIDRNK